jgi:hypothetical protein
MADDNKYRLCILSSDLSGVTGHHTIHVCIEETTVDGQVIMGVPETHGIEYQALRSRFGDDPGKWRADVADIMLKRHVARKSVHQEVLSWQGQKFDIPVPEK